MKKNMTVLINDKLTYILHRSLSYFCHQLTDYYGIDLKSLIPTSAPYKGYYPNTNFPKLRPGQSYSYQLDHAVENVFITVPAKKGLSGIKDMNKFFEYHIQPNIYKLASRFYKRFISHKYVDVLFSNFNPVDTLPFYSLTLSCPDDGNVTMMVTYGSVYGMPSYYAICIDMNYLVVEKMREVIEKKGFIRQKLIKPVSIMTPGERKKYLPNKDMIQKI